MLIEADILQDVICASEQFVTRQLLNPKVRDETNENAQKISRNLI